MPNEKKIEEVKELIDWVADSQAMIVADYRGLTVEQISELRSIIRKENSKFRVVKNRLMKIALKENDSAEIDDQLKGPTGVAFGFDDPVALAKVLLKYEEDNEKFDLKGGILGKDALDVEGIKRLSKMPGLQELRAQMAGVLKKPIRNVPVVMNKPGQEVAFAGMNAVKKMLYAFQNRASQLEEAS